MNILIKLMSIVSLVIAPHLPGAGSNHGAVADADCCEKKEVVAKACCKEKGNAVAMNAVDYGSCDISKCSEMTKEECAKHCDEMGCTADQKANCMALYGEDGQYIGVKKSCKGGASKAKACSKMGTNCDKGMAKGEKQCCKDKKS